MRGPVSNSLAVLGMQVVTLRADFQARVAEAEALKLQLAKAEATLGAATDLLAKLGGERGRWGEQLAGLSKSLEGLPMSALAAAGFVTYLPSLPEDVRTRVVADWCQ